MERKTAIIISLSMIVIISGASNVYQILEAQSTQVELDTTKLNYSYAMEMLQGFFSDRDGTEKSLQAIQNNNMRST